MSIIPSGWLERRRERARLKALRTGDSPEKLAERGGGPPNEEPGFVEKMFWLARRADSRGDRRARSSSARAGSPAVLAG
jgi:hypothetical protein